MADGGRALARALETRIPLRPEATNLFRHLERTQPDVLLRPEVLDLVRLVEEGVIEPAAAFPDNPRLVKLLNDRGVRATWLDRRSPTMVVPESPLDRMAMVNCGDGGVCAYLQLSDHLVGAARSARVVERPALVAQANAIRQAFQLDNEWSQILRGVTTQEEVEHIFWLGTQVSGNPLDGAEFLVTFFKSVRDTLEARPMATHRFLERIPSDWAERYAWYKTYPNGLKFPRDAEGPATLMDLARAQTLGNDPYTLYVLPFWKGPGPQGTSIDGGFDPVAYEVAEIHGGEPAFGALMEATRRRGVPVVVDIIPGHVSIQHEWIRQLEMGDLSMRDRFVPWPDGWEKVGEEQLNGRTYAVYEGPNGQRTHRWIIFPHDSRQHRVPIEVLGREEPVYLDHAFYRAQPRLNNRNPAVVGYFLETMGARINQGVLGFRIDAAQHLMVDPQTMAEGVLADGRLVEGMDENLHLIELFNRYGKMVSDGKVRLFPEVGADTERAVEYMGDETVMKAVGHVTPEISDGVWAFESRALIPETVARHWSKSYWALIEGIPDNVPANGNLLIFGSHHDEMPIREFALDPEGTLEALLPRGVPFREKNAVSGRILPLMGWDENMVELVWALQIGGVPHGVPVLYAGEEGALGNDFAHMLRAEAARRQLLDAQGIPANEPRDARDLHRQPIDFESVRDTERIYRAAQTYNEMLALRERRPSLRSPQKPLRIPLGPSLDDQVIAALRWRHDESDRPILMLVNPTPENRVLSIPRSELDQVLRSIGFDEAYNELAGLTQNQARIEGRMGQRVRTEVTESRVTVTMRPHSFLFADFSVGRPRR